MKSQSLIDRMTTAAQLARDTLPYGTVLVAGREYRMREDWWAVADRAALKYARKGAAAGAGARGEGTVRHNHGQEAGDERMWIRMR